MATATPPMPSESAPMPVTLNPRPMLAYFWRSNTTMTVFFLASIAGLLLALVGLALDPRTVLGQSTWAKTTKFTLSFIFYAPTMFWMFSHVHRWPRVTSFVMHSTAAILLLELVLLILQGARGVPMHFNVSTPFNAALWSIMSVTIIIFYVISIVGGALLVMHKMRDSVYATALRFGMILMLIGFGLGFLMTSPTPDQMAVLESGNTPALIGAHTVGAPDGGPGIRFLGWSTEHGDLRIAHFVGIHGAQFMLLAGWLATTFIARGTLSKRSGLAFTWVSFLSYGGLVALVTWQALRGQPLLSPDALTLSALGGLILATVAASGIILAANNPQKAVA